MHFIWHALEIIGIRRVSRSLSSAPDPDAATRELFLTYGRRARCQGFDRLYLVMSFDCDTPEDIRAVEPLHAWLSEHGIKATYAVPGAMLRQGAAVYRRIADAGGEFINHGALPHAEWREGRYWSVTFYHELPPVQVAEDIQRGHDIVREVIGKAPIGFRAPHFGMFQLPAQREILYAKLRELGYRYSSSTMPELALKNGPVVDAGGLVEIPLSGTYAAPLILLDSWGRIESPYNPVVTDEYERLFIETVEYWLSLGIVGILNFYVDPSHVYNAKPFYHAIEFILEHQIPALNFSEILDLMKMG